MERCHELKFEDDGSLRLAQKKAPSHTLGIFFMRIRMALAFVSLEGEEEDLLCRMINHAISMVTR